MAFARISVASAPLLLALLACTAASAGGSACDTANCGKGNCTEVSGVIPYECDCDPGWSHAIDFFNFTPCTVPKCSFDSACFNLTLPRLKITLPPDICLFVNCGAGGACNPGVGLFNYTCECQPGYANLLNATALPCVKSTCFFGMDCTAAGINPTPPPPPPSSPAPPGNHDSSGPTAAPPSSRKGNATALGSVSVRSLLQLLLLVSLAMVQLM